MTKQNDQTLCRLAVVCCALVCMAMAGCQPQNRSGSGLFGIGNRGTFNTGASLSSNIGQAAVAQAASGQVPFPASSPFGQFPQSSVGSGLFNFGGSSPNIAAAGSGTRPGNFNPSGLGQLGQPGISQDYTRIQQQLGAYDADNQLLNTEVATLQQKLELSNQYNQTLKQQLADTSDRVAQTGNQSRIDQQQFASMQQQVQAMQQRIAQQEQLLAQQERQITDRQITDRQITDRQITDRREDWQGNSGLQNSGFRRENQPFQNTGFSSDGSSSRGSATLRANNGLMQRINDINIPGGDARMDGDIIRIEFPTDRLFTSGSYRIQASQLPLLQNVASTIRQSFPRQIVGIEAHWDGTPLSPPGTTDHQLTATQSLAVFDELVRLGLPGEQLFTMAMASNRPRHRQQLVNGVSPNRRIELVIYPESYDNN